jgi:Lrp/AsnC family leucine-responsive transcriptional regulator
MPKPDLDAIDRRIVAALQANGRLSNVELAERVGLSPSPYLRRVQRLEREGYIEAYRAVLGRSRIGLGLTVFLGVKIDGHANERALALEEALLAMPEIVACHLVSGDADYLLEVVVPDIEHSSTRSWICPSSRTFAPTSSFRAARPGRHCRSTT